MAADLLQKQLDANSQRISGLGNPTTANDATFTDNATAPSNPTATASSGSSFKAAPADHVHQAVHSVKADSNPQLNGDVQLVSGSGVSLTQVGQVITVAVTGGLVNKLTWSEEAAGYSSSNAEEIIREWVVNLDDAGTGAGPNIQCRMSAIVKTPAGVATYKMYVGATAPGATAGATVRATFTTSSTTEVTASNQGAAFANPGGQAIVQLVSVSNTVSTKCFSRGTSFSIG